MSTSTTIENMKPVINIVTMPIFLELGASTGVGMVLFSGSSVE